MTGFEVAEVFVVGQIGVEGDGVFDAANVRERDDVPEILGHDVEGEEIYVTRIVGLFFSVRSARDGVAEVGAASAAGARLWTLESGFDLDAAKDAAAIDDEVVAGGIAPGFGDGESVGGGAGHELQFDPFAATFRVAERIFHKGSSR